MASNHCLICKRKLASNQRTYCGVKCKKIGHRVFIHLKNVSEKESIQKYFKEYYKKNKDELKVKSKEYVLTHRNKDTSYSRPKKNSIRDRIIDTLSHYEINKILTLESPEFLFSKSLPHKKIYAYEYLSKVYESMKLKIPTNVSLFNGDIIKFKDLEINVDFVYLDFCDTLSSNLERLQILKSVINNSKLFAITITPRNEKHIEAEQNFYIFVLKKLQQILGNNWEILWGQDYCDKGHSAMVTLLLKNQKLKGGDE